MKRDMVILLLACLIGLGAMECVNEANQVRQTSTVAWWPLLYEQPNPGNIFRVKVDFWWKKWGLKVFPERR